MDTVTHGLAGWLISRAIPLNEGKKEASTAVVLGSVLPDADNIVSLLGSELYLRLHRGISHSFVGVAATSLVIALLVYRLGKFKDLKKLYLFVLIGQFSHILLDLFNSYGTQILQPFSDARISFDLLFVVDLVFTGIIVAGIWLSKNRPLRARAALAVLVAYVGLAAFLHVRAEDAVREAAVRNGVPVVSAWALPRIPEMDSMPDLAPGRRAEAGDAIGSGGAEAIETPVKFPFPAGPFAWNGFVDDGSTFLRADVDPFDGTVEWKERERKGSDTQEAQSLLHMQDVRTYLWFARFPTVQILTEKEKTVVTFVDMRFNGNARRPFVLRVIESPGLAPRPLWGVEEAAETRTQ